MIVDASRETADELSDWFEMTGAVSVTFSDKEDDPILEPELGTTPLWNQVVVTALFSEEYNVEQIRKNFVDAFPAFNALIEKVEEREWTRVWMDQFQPMKFGDNLWICPSWQTPPNPNAVNLILDPGLAFGTGTHQTTSLCLTWLDGANLQGRTLLDFGCGSGILALAALKLGAQHTSALDIDPQALTATQNNAKDNQIDMSRLTVGFPDDIQTPVDIIIANILLKPLLELQDKFISLLKPQGRLIVSGILKEQIDELVEHYAHFFEIKEKKTLEDWALIEMQLR
tara:strand:+ start:2100 stop:2954 length:855 start_codon:yes stop_codon:yes gene_type:complete